MENGKNNNQNEALNTKTTASKNGQGVLDQAKSPVGFAYGVATKRAAEIVDKQKSTLAGGLTNMADTIKQVGENLNTNGESNLVAETAAKYSSSLASQIAGVSSYFENKDVREIVGDVKTFACKYPAYFVGGAFAIGFLASRFLKSSPPKQLTKVAGQSFESSTVNA